MVDAGSLDALLADSAKRGALVQAMQALDPTKALGTGMVGV